MASKKISELNSAATLTGAERFLIVQSGDNRQLTLDNLLAGLTTSTAVNPTLTLTSNALIIKGTGGNATNGIFRIQGNASNLPTILLSNASATKMQFSIGDLSTVGGTSLQMVETWNSSSLIHNTIDILLTRTASFAQSRVLSIKVGGTQVASIDGFGNIWGQTLYPVFPSFGFTGSYLGQTVNANTISIAASTDLSSSQLAQSSMIYLNQSGNANYNVTLPDLSADDSASGKVWTFIMNQSAAYSQTMYPVVSGQRGTLYWRYRTAATAGKYIMQWMWSKISGTGAWYPVTGSQFQTASVATAPTQGILLYDN
jgi:hypothetical protein